MPITKELPSLYELRLKQARLEAEKKAGGAAQLAQGARQTAPFALTLPGVVNTGGTGSALDAMRLKLPTPYTSREQALRDSVTKKTELPKLLTRKEFFANTPEGAAARQATAAQARANSDTTGGVQIYKQLGEAGKPLAAQEYIKQELTRGVSDSALNIANTVGGVIAGNKYRLKLPTVKNGTLLLETEAAGKERYAAGAAEYIRNSDATKQLETNARRSETLYERTNKGGLLRAGGELAFNIGQMIPTVIATAASGGAGAPAALQSLISTGLISGSTYSSSMRQALAEGASDRDAADYALLSAFVEGAGEQLIGGAAGLGAGIIDTATKGALQKLTSGITNPALRAAGSYLLKNIIGEGIEEGIQELGDVAAKRATYQKDAPVDWRQVGYAAAMGGAIGGIFGVSEIPEKFTSAQLEAVGAKIGESPELTRALINEAYSGTLDAGEKYKLTLPGGDAGAAKQLAAEIDAKLKAGGAATDEELGRLYYATAAAKAKTTGDKVTETVHNAVNNGRLVLPGTREIQEQYSFTGTNKNGVREYKTDFPETMSSEDKVKLYKDRIATIFNLGAVELKTDTKKIKVLGDKFTYRKNLYGNEIFLTKGEEKAKIDSLYDSADILANSKFVSAKPEISYTENILPKNNAHKDVKYWYKFENEIIYDGVPYKVVFNIRDKGKEQYQYLIEFNEQKNKANGNRHTVINDLRPTAQLPYSDNSIAQNGNAVNTLYTNGNKNVTDGRLVLPSINKPRFSVGDKTFTQYDLDAGVEKVSQMQSVIKITGDEFKKSEIDLATQVGNYFNAIGNVANSPQLGAVTLDINGVKDDIAHGIGRIKAASFAAVPMVIEQGSIIDFQVNWKGRSYDTAVVAAPVMIGDKQYLEGVVLIRKDGTNRFYVHEVLTQENGALPFKTGTSVKNISTPGGSAPSVISLLQKVKNVKYNSQKITDGRLVLPGGSPVALSGRAAGVSEGDIAAVERLSSKLGRNVEFYRADSTENGYYANDKIYINAASQNPALATFAHELTHSVESADAYAGLRGYVADKLGAGLSDARAEIIERYAKRGVSLDGAGADAELVADYLQKHLLTDEGAISSLVKDDRTLGQKIMDWLDGVIVKLTGTPEQREARRVRELYAKALAQSGTAAGAKYSINKTADNVPYVKIDRDILAGVPQSQWIKTVTDNLKNKFFEAVDANGQLIKIDRQSQDELTRSRSSTMYKKFKSNIYADKLRATDNIDDILRASKDYINEALKHPRKDNIVDFSRGSVNIEANGNKYQASVVIGILKNGSAILYDVVDINPVTNFSTKKDAEFKVHLDESSTTLDPSTPRVGAAPASDNSIFNSGEKVNPENENVTKKGMQSLTFIPDKSGDPLASSESRVGATPASDNSIFNSGEIVNPENENAINKKFSLTAEAEPKTAEELRGKAKDAADRAVKTLARNLGRSLSVKYGDMQGFLVPGVQRLAAEYMTNGKLSQDSIDTIFADAYERGRINNEEYIEDHKEMRSYLRGTTLTLSERDRADMGDYDAFRRRNFGVLRLKNEGGRSVDSFYYELSDMFPGTFPDTVTHPAEELDLIARVAQSLVRAETDLDTYYGSEASTYKEGARRSFEDAISSFLPELDRVKRYVDDANIRAKRSEENVKLGNISLDPDITSSDKVSMLNSAYENVKTQRKAVEKILGRSLLTEADRTEVERLLSGAITPDDLPPSINRAKILEVYAAKKKLQIAEAPIKMYNAGRKAALIGQADDIIENIMAWKDKKIGLAYSRETFERNIRDIAPDKETADRMIAAYRTPISKNEKSSNKFKNKLRDRVRALDISEKVISGNNNSESAAVQFVGEYDYILSSLQKKTSGYKDAHGRTYEDYEAELREFEAANPKLDFKKVREKATAMSKIYEELYGRLNEARMINGYIPIEHRKGYFPHFTDDAPDTLIAKFAAGIGIDTSGDTLPTTINGLTQDFKPGIKWMPNALQRKGVETTYDALKGFDRYIEIASDVIHHTEDIQRLRALGQEIRLATADEGLIKRAEKIRADETLTPEEQYEQIADLFKKGKFQLSGFVVDLDEYTNNLAGKKARMDRNTEQLLGRGFYKVMKSVESRVAANMVALNPGSWLTNFIPLHQAAAQVDNKYMVRGMFDTLKAFKSGDAVEETSAFLVNRRGSDPLVMSLSAKISQALTMPMTYIDAFTSGTVVRARYYKNLASGMNADASLTEADAFANSVIAGRAKGDMPTLFAAKNPIAKLFTQFQLEVNNELSYMFKDLPRELRGKSVFAIAAALLKYAVGAYLFNDWYEELVGRRPAFDPIGILNDTVGDLSGYKLPNIAGVAIDTVKDSLEAMKLKLPGPEVFQTKKTGTARAMANFGGNMVQNLPFIGGILDGGRLPIGAALPDLIKINNAIGNAKDKNITPKKAAYTIGKEAIKPIAYLLPPFGGGQALKTSQGIEAAAKKGVYTLDKEGKDQLQYPVSGTVGDYAKGALFGKSAFSGASDWVKGGFGSESVKFTAAYKALTGSGYNADAAYTALDAVRDAKLTDGKLSALAESKLGDDGKAIVYRQLIASDSEAAAMDTLSASGESAGRLYKALSGLRTAQKTKDKNAAEVKKSLLADSALKDESKAYIYQNILAGVKEQEMLSRLAQLGEDKIKSYELAYEIYSAEKNSDKYRALLDSELSEAGKVTVLGAFAYNTAVGSYKVASQYGISIDTYSKVQVLLSDAGSSVSQTEAERALKLMLIPKTQKAVLWQLMNKSWRADSNPYSVQVGRAVTVAMGGGTLLPSLGGKTLARPKLGG